MYKQLGIGAARNKIRSASHLAGTCPFLVQKAGRAGSAVGLWPDSKVWARGAHSTQHAKESAGGGLKELEAEN